MKWKYQWGAHQKRSFLLKKGLYFFIGIVLFSLMPSFSFMAMADSTPSEEPSVYIWQGAITGWGGPNSYPSSANHEQGKGEDNFYYVDLTNMSFKRSYGCGLGLMNRYSDYFQGAYNEMSQFITKMNSPRIKVTLKNCGIASSWNWDTELNFPSGKAVELPDGYLDTGFFTLFGNDDVITKVEIYDAKQDSTQITATPKPTKSNEPTDKPIVTQKPKETDDVGNSGDIGYNGNANTGQEQKKNISVSPTSLPTIPGLKASTDHYTTVTLTWKSIPGTSYQIYRSTFRSTGYQQIQKGITKTRYQDTSVKSGKSYYYRVRAVKTEGDRQTVQAESQTKQIKIRALARPVVFIRKKQAGGIRYLFIKIKKYQGKQIEIYYKDARSSSYRKIKLYENLIRKQKGIFRIQCLSGKRKLYLKVRTYQKKKGKKIYSLYTRAKKIKI